MAKQLPDISPPTRESLDGLHGAAAGAVPREELGEHEATTRKVANLQESTVTPTIPNPEAAAKPRRYRLGYPVMVAVVVGAAIAVGIGLRKHAPTTHDSARAVAPAPVRSADIPGELQPRAQPRAEPAPAPSRAIHLEIVVEPDEAKVTLDGAIIANPLTVDAPMDQSVHVLSASAPGFVPFSRTINYASDLRLAIELRRVPAAPREKPPVAKTAVRGGPPRSEARSPESGRLPPTAAKGEARSSSGSNETAEPGTNLGHPSQRRSRPIDERDPYAQ